MASTPLRYGATRRRCWRGFPAGAILVIRWNFTAPQQPALGTRGLDAHRVEHAAVAPS